MRNRPVYRCYPRNYIFIKISRVGFQGNQVKNSISWDSESLTESEPLLGLEKSSQEKISISEFSLQKAMKWLCIQSVEWWNDSLEPVLPSKVSSLQWSLRFAWRIYFNDKDVQAGLYAETRQLMCLNFEYYQVFRIFMSWVPETMITWHVSIFYQSLCYHKSMTIIT